MTTFPSRSFWAGLAVTGALAGAAPAHAVVLPSSNAMSTVQYGDFAVYSMDLLQQCAAALDSRCLPGGPFPIASNAGYTKTQLTVFTGEKGGPQTTNELAFADDPFVSPSGSNGNGKGKGKGGSQQTGHFQMGSALSPEPTPSFTGDRPGTWDIQISALRTYLGGNDLVFLFDNDQQGNAENQWLQIWGQAQVRSANGASELGCFELNSSSLGGCATSPPATPTSPLLDSAYVRVFTGYCVDKTTGAAFNLGAGTSATCEAQNGYHVNGNIGSANADNAAYSQALNDFIFAPTTSADWILSLDIRTANNNAGGETLWICSDCKVSRPTTTEVSEPASLALLGAALMGGAYVSRRRSRQA